MIRERRIPRLARWGVPAGAIALTGIVAAGYAAAGAQAVPALPSLTPVQLLAAVSSARLPPPMTAVVQESAALGIPDLPSSGDPLSGLSWLSGTHTVKIWYADPAHLRVEVPVQLGESDVRRDGRNVWYWNSQANQAAHLVLPAQAAGSSQDGNSAAGSARDSNSAVSFAGTAPTPQQVARQLLTAVGPTTKVGPQQNVTIAGQPAYQISLAPKASGSLIGQIRIAVDARRAMPLRVQIFARGASGPAFQVGFTSLQFGTPAAANFAFSPPPGAKVKTVTVPAGAGPGALSRLSRAAVSSNGGGFISTAPTAQERIKAVRTGKAISLKSLPKGAPVIPPVRGAALRIMRLNFAAHLPKGLTAAQRQAALRQFDTAIKRVRAQVRAGAANGALASGSVALGPLSGAPLGLGAVPGLGLPLAGAPTVLGKAWLTVLAFSANSPALSQGQRLVIPGKIVHIGPGKVARIPAGSALRASLPGQAPAQVRIGTPGPVRRDLAFLGVLLRAATPVHGSWGSGRLLTTGLVSVLVTDNGKVLIGAVTPAVLYADAAHLR
jgi:outer membrane lipoprotein-sorting protein